MIIIIREKKLILVFVLFVLLGLLPSFLVISNNISGSGELQSIEQIGYLSEIYDSPELPIVDTKKVIVELDKLYPQYRPTNHFNRDFYKELQETQVAFENAEIIQKGEYYLLRKKTHESNGANILLEFYDKSNNVLWFQEYGTRAPNIRYIEENLIEVCLSIGNPGPKYYVYYDIERGQVSNQYVDSKILQSNPLLIYFIDVYYDKSSGQDANGNWNRTASILTVRDVFDESNFSKSIYRDFLLTWNASDAIQTIEIIGERYLDIEYFTNEDEYLTVTERIDMYVE